MRHSHVLLWHVFYLLLPARDRPRILRARAKRYSTVLSRSSRLGFDASIASGGAVRHGRSRLRSVAWVREPA